MSNIGNLLAKKKKPKPNCNLISTYLLIWIYFVVSIQLQLNNRPQDGRIWMQGPSAGWYAKKIVPTLAAWPLFLANFDGDTGSVTRPNSVTLKNKVWVHTKQANSVYDGCNLINVQL